MPGNLSDKTKSTVYMYKDVYRINVHNGKNEMTAKESENIRVQEQLNKLWYIYTGVWHSYLKA